MVEDLSFIDYVNIYHKDVADEYVAYMRRNTLPKVGSRVMIKKGSHMSLSYDSRKTLHVVELNDKHIILVDFYDNLYCCSVKDWYRQIEIIK